MTREERVKQFLDKAGEPTFEVVWACLAEEYQELQEAALKFHEAIASDFTDEVKANARELFVKEWADCQYVLSQVACFYNIPGEEAFTRVADNNMTKVEGEIIRREDGKILKPDGYRPPDMGGL